MIDETTAFCPHCGYGQKTETSPFGMKPGTILRGRYLAGRMLGQGGFGITYVGYDLTLEIKIAIKEYFPSGSVTRNSTVSNQVQWNTTQFDREQWQAGCESFLKEARRMAKLDSLPGIVRVRDTFPENQTAYIVMDFVEGETLKQKLMKTGPMKYTECLRMLRPLMESLGKMHRQGLVHRDISPDNIMVQPDGSVCLLDFGAAKDVSFQQNAASQQIAKKGFSPLEQYREKGSIGSWTDVYALCATIYYCITGKLVPEALDRLYEDELTFDMFLAEPLSEMAVNTLRDGLKLRSEERIQTIEELLGRFDGMPDSGKDMYSGSPEESVPEKKEESESISQSQDTQPQQGDAGTQYPNNSNVEQPEVQDKKIKKKVGIAAAVVVGLFILIGLMPGSNKKEPVQPQPADSEATADAGQAQGSEDTGNSLAEGETVRNSASNRLMEDNSAEYSTSDSRYYGTVLGSEISRDSIATVTFTDTLDAMADNAWDVSKEQNSTVMAWTEPRASEDQIFDLFIGAEGKISSEDCSGLFEAYHNVESIEFNDCFDVSQTTNMYCMFYECENLTQLDVSGFDTSQVTDMGAMFAKCKSLTQLDVSGFDTSRVTNMSGMFNVCASLTRLDAGNFDTSQVTAMSWMFSECYSLSELNLNSFDTSQVTNMKCMFQSCNNLKELDLSSFDTGRVTDMAAMFSSCSNLSELNINGFDTSQVTDMSWMFYYCANLTQLDVRSFDTGKVETTENMFTDCGITAIEAGFAPEKSFNILMKDDSAEWIQQVWLGTVLGSEISRDSIISITFLDSLKDMPDTAWDVSQEHDGAVMAWVRQSSRNEEMLDLFIGAEGGVAGNDCRGLFEGYCNVESIEFNHCFDTSQVTDMGNMFNGCENLTQLDVSGFDTSQVTNMAIMFNGCANLKSLDAGNFETGQVTDMSWMFSECYSLSELNLNGFDTSQVTNMRCMFQYCINLMELDLSSFDTGRVTDMTAMFSSCNNLSELNISSFDTSQVTSMSFMFAFCGNLFELDLSNFDTGNVQDFEEMFKNTGLTAEGVNLKTE